MEQRPFGSTKREVAVVGQGTWNIEQADPKTAVGALRRGLDLGMTHIDTAEMYGSGAAEELVGEAIAGRRDAVFLVSKVLPHNASRNGTIAACERSLKRLEDRPTGLLSSSLARLASSWRHGRRIRAATRRRQDPVVGRQQFRRGRSRRVKPGHGGRQPACNQVLYHLRERAIEHAVIPWCEANGVAVVAYSPFGHAGGFPEPHSAGGRVLKAIAERHDSTPRQVALRFLTRRAVAVCDPQGFKPRACRRERGRRRTRSQRRRTGSDRRRIPAWASSTLAANALAQKRKYRNGL